MNLQYVSKCVKMLIDLTELQITTLHYALAHCEKIALKKIVKQRFHEIFCQNSVTISVRVNFPNMWKLRILLSLYFGKNFVKPTYLLNIF